jgi:hypothetical protein
MHGPLNMHGPHHLGQHAASASRLGGGLNVVLNASAGAGLAVLGAYVLSRTKTQRDLAERIGRLEEMVKELERSAGGAPRE